MKPKGSTTTMARFITSSKGKRKVADENHYVYDFHSHNVKLEKDYWRCEHRKSCSVRIHTVMEEDIPRIVYVSGDHKHPAEAALVTARIAVAEMKDEAVASISNSVRNVISESVNSLDDDTTGLQCVFHHTSIHYFTYVFTNHQT